MSQPPHSFAHVLPLIIMAFVAGGLVASATFAMCILLPSKLLGYGFTMSSELTTAIFIAGGIVGMLQIARDRPSDPDS